MFIQSLKNLLKKSSLTAGSLALLVLAGEGATRLLPVNQGFDLQMETGEPEILKFQPNQRRWFSRGPTFEIRNLVEINNEGWRSNLSYRPGSSGILGVIGDSYVEAAQVAWTDSFVGILQKEPPRNLKIWSFGVSYYPLSQYLAVARYLSKKYRPSGLIITVVANDFDESLESDIKLQGLYFFREDPKGHFFLENKPFVSSKKLIHQSRLYMYLSSNCELFRVTEAFQRIIRTGVRPNEERKKIEDQEAMVKEVIRVFLDRLPAFSGLTAEKILFVVDGDRPGLYQKNPDKSRSGGSFASRREDFIRQARFRGYFVIDLQPAFQNNYWQSGQKMEFPHDAHWNEKGHSVVAEQIRLSEWWQGFFR